MIDNPVMNRRASHTAFISKVYELGAVMVPQSWKPVACERTCFGIRPSRSSDVMFCPLIGPIFGFCPYINQQIQFGFKLAATILLTPTQELLFRNLRAFKDRTLC